MSRRSLLAGVLAAAALGCGRASNGPARPAGGAASGEASAASVSPATAIAEAATTAPPAAAATTAPAVATLPPALPPLPEPMPGRHPVPVEMRNVDLHITDDITLHIRHLDGRFVGIGKSGIPYLDDSGSYAVVIDSAVIVMDMPSLNALLNQHVLGHGHSNVEGLRVTTDDEGRLVQKGEVDKGSTFPSRSRARWRRRPMAGFASTRNRSAASASP